MSRPSPDFPGQIVAELREDRAFTREAFRAFDRYAQEVLGIPGEILMENAGAGVALEALRLARDQGSEGIVVFAGTGNNGGDGFVAPRQLAGSAPVTVWVAGDPVKLRGAALVQCERARGCGVKIESLGTGARLRQALEGNVTVVDAIFGTGLDRPIEGWLREAIAAVNATGRPVLAVDIPSGLDADTGAVLGAAVRATRTVTFVCAKAGFFRGQGPAHTGEVIVRGIGVPCTERAATPGESNPRTPLDTSGPQIH